MNSRDAEAPLILGIETSCDETAAAIVDRDGRVLGASVATQHDLHEEYGGVVPEIASRAHLERVLPVVRAALRAGDLTLDRIAAVAVGNRPGLIGALLVGTSAAKGFALALDVPFLGVDHVHAHLVSGLLSPDGGRVERPELPAIGLVLSGGHTSLYEMSSLTEPRLLGRTIDDAIGEAFDKVAALLGLGHPGGPKVEALAVAGDPSTHDFPVANLGRDRLDFSYSGLKTAVRYAAHGVPGRSATETTTLDEGRKADLAAAFQKAAITAVRGNLRRAIERRPEARSLLVGGGVVANKAVRTMLVEEADAAGLDLRLPTPDFSQDNGAMIAFLGALRLDEGRRDPLDLVPAATTRSS